MGYDIEDLESFPTDLENVTVDMTAEFGFKVVKPIVDKYGEKGVLWMMTNPPLEDDLPDIESYHQRAFYEIFESHAR